MVPPITVDVPMARVKFNVNTEYAYLSNFKILQNVFTKHSIERSVPVEALIKCRMQDNLEFLQWTKRYWDQYYPGGEYDAIGRRKAGGGGGFSDSNGPRATAAAAPKVASTTTGARRAPAVGRTGGPQAGVGGGIRAHANPSPQLQQENATLKETVQGLEKERDFYFSKLRDIELLLQQAVEANPELEKEGDTDEQGTPAGMGALIKSVQTILYSTEVSDAVTSRRRPTLTTDSGGLRDSNGRG